MYFKRVLKTVNRPHFLGERDGDVIILNFCHDHRTMKCRTVESSFDESSLGHGESVFGYGGLSRNNTQNRGPKVKQIKDFELNGNSRHGFGAADGKVYFLDDSPRGQTTTMWRADCQTGQNEFTKCPSGFISRFSDSDYFLVTQFRDSKKASIYKWKTGDEVEPIKTITMPNNVSDHTRIAYGSQLIFIKVEDTQIMITSFDVITYEEVRKNFPMDNITDTTVRWICAKDHLITVISGRAVFIDIHSFKIDIAPTNLEASGKYHPFGVDSHGFVYLLWSTPEGCTVQRAMDPTLTIVEENRIVIPKSEKAKAQNNQPIVEDKNNSVLYMNVHFHVTYRGNVLLDQSMRMLCSKPLGDVIRRSPEIAQPQNTRLKIFYKNQEELAFRTPNFLRMKDGDKIHAEFMDKDVGDPNELPQAEPQNQNNTGFFSRDELDEIKHPKKKEVPKQKTNENSQPGGFMPGWARSGPLPVPTMQQFNNVMEDQKMLSEKPSQQGGNLPASQKPKETVVIKRNVTAVMEDAPESSGVNPMVESTNAPRPPAAQPSALNTTASNTEEVMPGPAAQNNPVHMEKLLEEMAWLREYIYGDDVLSGQANQLDVLKRKYARVLLMLGRSELKK